MVGQRARRPAGRPRPGPQRQELSSRWTGFYRTVFPALWIGVGGLALVQLSGAARGSALPFVAIWLGVGIFLIWLAGALRRVALEGDTLVVSSRRETHRFSFLEIERVSGTVLLNPDLVFVHFRRPTAFGSRVAFIPRQRSFRLFGRHPLVDRLQALVDQHRAPGLPPALEEEARPRRSALRLLVFGALGLGLVLAVVAGAFTVLLRSAGPYTAALQRAASHPALRAELGEPIRPGWLLSGRVQVADEAGTADLAIPLSGPRGEAELRARATLRDDEWIFQELTATLRDGRSLDLLAPAERAEPAGPVGELL